MENLEQIELMNETMIVYLKKLGKDTKRNDIIREILKDDMWIKKMNKEDAIMILKDVGIGDEKLEEIYSELISKE